MVEDLGFPDRRILENAFDAVVRNEDHIQRLWDQLKDSQVEFRWDVKPPPGFRDPGKVQMCGSSYPSLDSKSSEGKCVWKLSQEIERDPKLKCEAKARNRARNGGVLVCEACGFSGPLDTMFDAHHQQPLAIGVRKTRVDDLFVLCPTCHRWAHAKAADVLSPILVQEISQFRRGPAAES